MHLVRVLYNSVSGINEAHWKLIKRFITMLIHILPSLHLLPSLRLLIADFRHSQLWLNQLDFETCSVC